MGKVTDLTERIKLYEQCPACGNNTVRCIADPPGSWEITQIECAECGLPLWIVDED